MEKTTLELLPGVYLTALHTDKFKTGCLSVNLLRPMCQEEAAMNALLPDVLSRGCELCPDLGSLSRWMDERYGAGVQSLARKRGEVQAIGFFFDWMDEHYALEGERLLEDVCSLMGSMLLHPVLENGAFRKDYVDGEKVNLINGIMAQLNDKRSYASLRLMQEMFRGEAYGVSRLGDRAHVEPITPEGLYAHYREILETSRIELLAVGNFEPERLKSALLSALDGLPRGTITPVGTEMGPWPERVREVTEDMDVTQGKLVMGFRTGVSGKSPDYPAMLMMNGVYGGSLTSKLFMNVREKMSLCYYASSGIDQFKGVLLVSSGVDTDKYETARAEILAQLEAVRRGEISAEELESTRSYLVSNLKTGEDSPYGIDGFYLSQRILGLNGTPEALAERLMAVTVADIQRAAEKVTLDTVYFLKGEARA